MRSTAPLRRPVGVALALGAAGLLATGCATSPAAPPVVVSQTPAPTISTSPTPDPVEQTKAEVLAVYRTFMDARNKSLNDPTKRPDGRLDRISTGIAKRDLFSLAVFYRARGIAIRGAITSNLAGRDVSVFGETAKIIDCVDGSAATPILVRSGKSVLAPNQSPRLVVDSVAVFDQGEWRISSWTPRRPSSC